MRTAPLVTTVALALGLVGAAALPASAATTTTTFSIGSGALNISAPATINLGAGTAGATLSGQMGTVQVTDARAGVALWTATVSSTTFASATPAQTIPIASISYWSGASTATTGAPVAVPGQPLAANAVAFSATATTAFTTSTVLGNNSVSWNPTLVVAVPAQTLATALFTATVTHSVS